MPIDGAEKKLTRWQHERATASSAQSSRHVTDDEDDNIGLLPLAAHELCLHRSPPKEAG